MPDYKQQPKCFIHLMVKSRTKEHSELDLDYLRCIICDGYGNYKIGGIERKCSTPPDYKPRKKYNHLETLEL